MMMSIITPVNFANPDHDLRIKVSSSRTALNDGNIYDKVTGEHYGSYLRIEFSPEPILDEPRDSHHTANTWGIAEDGSPLALVSNVATPELMALARVIEFPLQSTQQHEEKPRAGRKPQAIENPLASALCVLSLEERVASWLDDYTFGAIYIGPGIVNGKHSVSQADVKKLLRLPVISVATAAGCLLNHEKQPMSTRQLQRVVEAARTALRGIALYLERHPEILQSVDQVVDFEKFWAVNDEQTKLTAAPEHSLKQQALDMLKAGKPIKTTATDLGISKNTVKRWLQKPNSA